MTIEMRIDLPPSAVQPRESSRTVPGGDPMVEIDHLRFYYSGKEAVKDVTLAFPKHQVRTYLNTLWLQDHERWHVLEQVVEA